MSAKDEMLARAANSEMSDDAFRLLSAALRSDEDFEEVLADLRARADELDDAAGDVS